MQFNKNVSSGVRQPDVETNGGLVYTRLNFVQTKKDEQDVWVYDEYVIPVDEYNDIQVGRWNGEWDDTLRGIQREHLYNYADKMISKYSTDVFDEAKKQAWITYKASIRATQKAQGYPQNVVYPIAPE